MPLTWIRRLPFGAGRLSEVRRHGGVDSNVGPSIFAWAARTVPRGRAISLSGWRRAGRESPPWDNRRCGHWHNSPPDRR